MLGSDLYNYILKKFKRTDKSDEVYQAITDTIADMRIQFDAEDFKEEAYATGITTLGEYKMALPSDFGHIIGDITYVDTTSNDVRTLNKISKQAYDDKYGDRLYSSYSDTYSGTPLDFCIYGKQLFIGPVPDSVDYKYQMNYATEDYSEITASTADVPFSGKNRNLLRNGVLAELHDGLENYEESGYWRAMYTNGLSKLISNDNGNISDSDATCYSGV